MKRKCLAVFTGVMIFFCGTGALRVSANTLTPTINNITFSAYSNIYATSGNAGTVGGSPNLQVSVSATYSYVNVDTLETGTMQDNKSDIIQRATVNFNAPANCRSVKINAYHTASSGTESWSGSTDAIY